MNDQLSAAVHAHGGLSRVARLLRLQELKLKRTKTMTYKLNIRRVTLGLLPIIALVFGGALAATSQTSAPRNVKNIVLIHGGFVDGSGWEGVYNTLKKKGYNITIVQNPTISLADDVGRNKEGHCRAGWPSHPCRAFVWGRRDYGSGYRPQGGGACLCCRICA